MSIFCRRSPDLQAHPYKPGESIGRIIDGSRAKKADDYEWTVERRQAFGKATMEEEWDDLVACSTSKGLPWTYYLGNETIDVIGTMVESSAKEIDQFNLGPAKFVVIAIDYTTGTRLPLSRPYLLDRSQPFDYDLL